MKARIYKPAKNPMQSGRAKTTDWVLEYELETPRKPDDLMGWISAEDTLNQVRMRFSSRDAAIAFATENNIAYTVSAPQPRKIVPRSYVDNFKYFPPDADA